MRVMVFGSYDKVAHPRVAVVIDGLRAHGVTVDECNAPLGLDTAARVALLRQPWRLPLLVARLVRAWLRLAQRSRRLPPPDAVLVAYLGHFDVHLARRLFPRVPLVLDHFVSGSDTARDRGASGPVRDRLLGLLDRAALRTADLVMTDTEEHRHLTPAWAWSKGVVVPVGAADEWARAAAGRPVYDGERPLQVIFFGLYTPLQGAVTIGHALGLLADDERIAVTMVGSGQDLVATQHAASANQRVQWMGLVPAGRLPSLVAEHDVCLGIFGTTPKALRVVPNKAFQGLRAGCAVVTSDTDPQRRMLAEAAAFVAPGDAAALAERLRGLAAAPGEVAELQRRSRAAADRFAPDAVVQPLLGALQAAVGRR